jgi:uncharacterized protein YlaI
MSCTCKSIAPGMKTELCQECINKITIKELVPDSGTEKPLPLAMSARYNEGKIQTREIDPNFILGIGEVLTKSRAKYEHFNWCKPTKLSTPYESMMRHLMAFQKGEELDNETGSHHLLHAATNLMFMYYHVINNKEESDDRFFKKQK